MSEIQRPGALYRQVAAALREAILSGEYAPDSQLPSEAQLMARHGVSRPTVRNAVAALRAEGLIDVRHGKGSFVRSSGGSGILLGRQVGYNSAGQFTTYTGVAWDLVEEPSVTRARATAETGPQLYLEVQEALFVCDRLLVDVSTGTRGMHRVLIPFAVADQVPELAEHPDTEPDRIYELLTLLGHSLKWFETVRARMPLPDERTALHAPDATPVLQLKRITHGNDDHPLIVEELRLSADRAELLYRITAHKEPERRPRA